MAWGELNQQGWHTPHRPRTEQMDVGGSEVQILLSYILDQLGYKYLSQNKRLQERRT